MIRRPSKKKNKQQRRNVGMSKLICQFIYFQWQQKTNCQPIKVLQGIEANWNWTIQVTHARASLSLACRNNSSLTLLISISFSNLSCWEDDRQTQLMASIYTQKLKIQVRTDKSVGIKDKLPIVWWRWIKIVFKQQNSLFFWYVYCSAYFW